MERFFTIETFKMAPAFAKEKTTLQRLGIRKIMFGRTVDGQFTYLVLPTEIERVVRILVTGETDTGKSLLIRVLMEGFLDEIVSYGDWISHPIFVFDFKGNYMGLTKPNKYENDKILLKGYFFLEDKHIYGFPPKVVNIFCPPHAIPLSTKTDEGKKKFLQLMKEYRVRRIWRMPWRFITDPSWLVGLFKMRDIQTSWLAYLHPILAKLSIRENITIDDILKGGGLLEEEIKKIDDARIRNALYTFIDKWRRYRYMFTDEDALAKHLGDKFSINVLTFLPTSGQTYSNNLCFLVALESLISSLQHMKLKTQPVFIFHDMRNILDPKAPFSTQIVNALTRLVYGQARTKYHGYIVIFEIQNENALPSMLTTRELSYHYVFRCKWKTGLGKYFPSGGFCDYIDNYHGTTIENIVVRPPRTNYVM